MRDRRGKRNKEKRDYSFFWITKVGEGMPSVAIRRREWKDSDSKGEKTGRKREKLEGPERWHRARSKGDVFLS